MLDAQLRYYFKIDPDLLTDEEWALRIEDLNWVRKKEGAKPIKLSRLNI